MKIFYFFFFLFLTLTKGQTEIFLSENKEEEKNQLEIEYKKGVIDPETVLSYPKQLSTDKKHAVVVWAPGNGAKASDYESIIRRLASHGFVVLGLSTTPGDGSKAVEALNFLEEQNKSAESPLNGKLDVNMAGCSGHSMGGAECRKVTANDKRIKTAILNNSGDWEHVGMASIPEDKPVAIVYANNGMERPNSEADYGNENVKAPSCLIMMDGANYEHGSGPGDGMAATVAWLRWHLGGEVFRKADFVGTTGKYIDGPILGHQGNWKGQCKNF